MKESNSDKIKAMRKIINYITKDLDEFDRTFIREYLFQDTPEEISDFLKFRIDIEGLRIIKDLERKIKKLHNRSLSN